MVSSRSISSLMASRSASRNVMTRLDSDIDVLEDRLRRGWRRLLGERHGVRHGGLGLVVELLQALLSGDAERLHAMPQDVDRITLHPLLHLFLGAVLRRVRHGVSAEAIGLRLEEERQALGTRALDSVAYRSEERRVGKERRYGEWPYE